MLRDSRPLEKRFPNPSVSEASYQEHGLRRSPLFGPGQSHGIAMACIIWTRTRTLMGPGLPPSIGSLRCCSSIVGGYSEHGRTAIRVLLNVEPASLERVYSHPSEARAISSVGQSARFTSVRSLVRAQYRPPAFEHEAHPCGVRFFASRRP